MPDELIELSDIEVSRVGLVRRPSARMPQGDGDTATAPATFFFVKSEDGTAESVESNDNDGGIEMTEQLSDAPNSEVEEYAERLAQAEAKARELEEKFSASETKATKLAEQFAEERHRRRLNEFSEMVRGMAFAAEPEQFAEDLMALEDFNADLYDRWVQRLKALDEQVKTGELYTQKSKAGGAPEGRHPFEVELEKVRTERFADKEYAVGYAEAFKAVQDANPDLATRYLEGK